MNTLPKTLALAVTSDDIETGVCNDPCLCPIARAIHRTYGIASVLICVSPHDIKIDNGERMLVYEIPEEASDFIEHFDDGDHVSPFEFKASERSVRPSPWQSQRIL